MLKKYVSSLLILPLIVINICFTANSQSLSKVEIGNHADSLKDLELDLIATDEIGGYSIRKFRLNNGNYLSVTYETSSQRIVFIEADSSRNSIEKSNFRDFSYGLTTLAEIRQVLGSNGCSYHENGVIETPRGIAFINAYQIRNNSEIMGVFISHLNSSDFQVVKKNPDKIADFATLDSIILSEENYLNKIWGHQQGCDPNYEPINWYSDRSLHTEALINPSWREVPGTATPENSQSGSPYSDPAYINENSQIKRGETVIYDLVNSDSSYARVEFNCETLQYRNLRLGTFESSTRVHFLSKVEDWKYPTSPYHSKLLTFVCFSFRK